jgi:mono/diheme cytochrome c family protein
MNAAVKLFMLLSALFLGVAFLLQDFSSVAGQEKTDKEYPLIFSAEQRAQAKTTFKDATVLGDMLFPPDFTDHKWWKNLTNETLMQSITNGKEEMPPFGNKLTKPEILALIAYVRCFDKSAASDQRKATCD